MRKVLFSAAVISAATALALPRAVCFRFDDNQTAQKYSTLAETFRKNGVRFSMSLIPFAAQSKNEEWKKMVRTLADDGFEVMDHTPGHNTVSFILPANDPLLKKAAESSFVHHISNNQVCLKYNIDGSRWSEPFYVDITDGNKISASPHFKYWQLIELNNNYYYVSPRSLRLLSIWGEKNVKLPDGKNLQARACKSNLLLPHPEATEFLIRVSQEGFRRIGLKKMPVVWVQPGGPYPRLTREETGKILKKYGYVSATTHPGVIKGFGDPEIEINRYSLNWGDFNLERQSIAQIKTRIADAVACHQTPVASSHFRIKCSLEEYAAQHDELLKWMKKSNIQVLTQGDLAKLLAETKISPEANAFPSLACDLDENGRPDGIFASSDTVFTGNTVQLKGKGKKLWVRRLCGLPKGKATFSITSEKTFNGAVKIRFFKADGKPVGSFSGKVKANNCDFIVPANCAHLDFELIKHDSGQCTISDLKLAGTK